MRARMLCESTDMAYSSWEITSEEPLLVKASTARSFSTWNRLGQKRRGMFSIGTEGAIVMSAGTAPSRPVASCFQWRFEASAPTAVLRGSPACMGGGAISTQSSDNHPGRWGGVQLARSRVTIT